MQKRKRPIRRGLGAALTAAALLAAAAQGCSEDSLPAAPTTTSAAGAGAASETPDPAAVALYIANCSSCHAADGSGATGLPIGDGALNAKYTRSQMEALIRVGTGTMAGLGDRLSTQEIADIVDYVRNHLKTAAATSAAATDENGGDATPGTSDTSGAQPGTPGTQPGDPGTPSTPGTQPGDPPAQQIGRAHV